MILRTQGLRGERDGAHAQETEQPEQAIENDGCDGDAAEQRGLAQPADAGCGDDAE